ncbi:MAG: AAA family ATPase [Lentisphaeria bacterium]|nr:AAA family ATPase [Lentisphaeria bacterium]
MKILEIQIDNFGKFHNFSYKFNGSGIEILNGENEFGKTTLLTFVQRVLYGFPDKRHAENLYESEGSPYGGRLLCLSNDNKYITIERLGTAKGGTLRIYDTASGEEFNSVDYIRQGAEFYRNIYMIHLKDLLSEASLLSGEIRHHLYGIERAFGNISPIKIQETLQKKCDSLYRPKGSTQLIPKLAKELKAQELELSELNLAIKDLTSQCSGEEDFLAKRELLKNQLSAAEKITAVTQKIEELKQIANAPFSGEMPDNFILQNREKITSLIEQRQSVAENHRKKIQTQKQIDVLNSDLAKLQFSSCNEYEIAKAEYEKSKAIYTEKLLRQQIIIEEETKKSANFKKIKIAVSLASAVLFLLAITGLCFKLYPLAILLFTPVIPLLLKNPKKQILEELTEPEDKTAFFNVQYELLKAKDELAKLNILADKLQKQHTNFMHELQIFKEYLPANFSDSGDSEIAILQQNLDNAIRCDIQFEMYKKNSVSALSEAEKLKNTVDIMLNSNPGITENINSLKEKLAETERICTEISLRKQQLADKNAIFSKLESKYLSAKNSFNEHFNQYLKWKNALNIWEKTINVFEKERQGDVMLRASELFSRITNGKYQSVRKSISADNNLVVFDGKNDKSVDKLSSGTREQLLFVLRLALIEYIEKNAPQNIAMPVLMDDIFVNYDNEREQNAWDILKEFSCKRQIIFCRAKTEIADA